MIAHLETRNLSPEEVSTWERELNMPPESEVEERRKATAEANRAAIAMLGMGSPLGG